jgi:hypothetical protein
VVLWGKPRRWILRNFSGAELEELLVYRRIEPWGGEWENLRAGTIASAAAGANPFRKAYSVPKPGDWFKKAKRVGQSEREVKSVMENAAKRFAAFRKRRKHG